MAARADYARSVSSTYDEVLDEVADRISREGSVGKFDIAGLCVWKRLRADTHWVRDLMAMNDRDVRRHTAGAVDAARDSSLSVPDAAGRARSALVGLPGFIRGDAIASAVCFASAPARLAVYDQRAHVGLHRAGSRLDNRPGRYRRYIEILLSYREEFRAAGQDWTLRDLDLALFQLGG